MHVAHAEGDLAAFAAALTATGFVTDPWIDGCMRFGQAPLRLRREDHATLAGAAEAIAAVYDELCRVVSASPHWLQDFFGLTPVQQAMWLSSAPLWHGLARADVFVRDDGSPVVCELNCDTPSGLSEAVVLGRLADAEGARDPNASLGRAFVGLVETLTHRCLGRGGALAVGLVYPTELAEDLGLVRLYSDWLTEAGHSVVLGSPFNLHPTADGGVRLFGTRCDAIIRHYKTDWWGERRPVWHDEDPYPDPDPLLGPLSLLLQATFDRQVVVMNPFGAVLPQNKRAMAFMWEHQDQFSSRAKDIIQSLVPETFCLERLDPARLRDERTRWVLKSDYGCEGDEVILGTACDASTWDEALAMAVPGRWIAQRFFEARRDGEGRIANHGVYLAGGRACGLFTRLSPGATDPKALCVPTLVEP